MMFRKGRDGPVVEDTMVQCAIPAFKGGRAMKIALKSTDELEFSPKCLTVFVLELAAVNINKNLRWISGISSGRGLQNT